ncbi:MAG: HtaA domain-containing protein, partial [Streptomyces sp.]|nr:HtaA domain-containing protein [Streptomyces sp.]
MPTRSRRRTTVLAAAVATAATLGVGGVGVLGATSASAAEVPLTGYELTWGIKQSYRTYVATFAAGTFTAEGGASQAEGNGAFTFVNGTGSYDSTSHAVSLGFEGALHIESKAHGFAVSLSDVRFDSGSAEITADVTRDGTTSEDVPLAEVTVTRAMTDMATTLTAEAAEVFGSASYAGAAGDPLTVVRKQSPTPSASESEPESASPSGTPSETASETESQSPSPSASPSGTGSASPSATATSSPSASPSVSATTEAPAGGDIVDGKLVWGVKESFRTYVVDGVARGEISVSGGASQAPDNGVFTFVDATGTFDGEKLSAVFEGAVNFRGHEQGGTYGLDLTLSDLKVAFDGEGGELLADVTSLGEESPDVVLAELTADAADLAAEDDVVALDDVTAELTEAGAEAFGGFYPAGTALDPVDLSVALSADAQLPDGGSSSGGGTGTGGGSGTGSTTTGGVTGSAVTGGLAATGAGVPVAGLGTAAAVAVV